MSTTGKLHPLTFTPKQPGPERKIFQPLLDTTRNTVGSFYTAAKARISRGLSVDTLLLPTETDGAFDDLLDTFHNSRNAFERAEDLFWKLRVQNEELKELLRVTKQENELLKEEIALRKPT
jgi:hypothetical protein